MGRHLAGPKTKGFTMRSMTYLWKDPDSNTGNCPGLIATEGGYIVVGVKLSEEDLKLARSLSAENDAPLADHEDALFVPSSVLDRLKEA